MSLILFITCYYFFEGSTSSGEDIQRAVALEQQKLQLMQQVEDRITWGLGGSFFPLHLLIHYPSTLTNT